MNALVPQTPNNNQPAAGRRTPSVPELYALIDLELGRLTNGKEEFTAYGVTLNLRHANPGLEIVHNDVRDRVHHMMEILHVGPLSSTQSYGSQMRSYPDGDAETYFPILFTVTSTATAVTPAQKQSSAPAPVQPRLLPAPNDRRIVWTTKEEDDQ